MTEVTTLAAAALAARDALERVEPAVESLELALLLRVAVPAPGVRGVERVVEDVQRRFGVAVQIDWR